MEEPLLIERVRAGVALVTLNRPDRLNALEEGLFAALSDAMVALDHDTSVKVIVVTGAGRAFCSGHDLDELEGRRDRSIAEQLLRIDDEVATLLKLRTVSTPTIAAVNGAARGGGLSLAAACDLRIASTSATFGSPLVKMGMSGGVAGLSWTLPRLIGHAAAADLMFTGRVLDAEGALRLGLVSRLTEPGMIIDEALTMAEAMAAHPMQALWMTKRALNASASLSLAEAAIVESTVQVVAMGSPLRGGSPEPVRRSRTG